MSKINWKLRLQNKITLLAILGDVVAIVFSIISLVQTKEFTYESVMHIISLVVEVLVLLGIVVDPTTAGMDDSIQAQGYEKPKTIEQQLDEVRTTNEEDAK